MGRAKEFMLEQEERGFYSVGDKFLCSRCCSGQLNLANDI